MGYNQAEIQEGIGHMLEAFKVGTPPHGGIALGLDRLAMVLSNVTSMKDTVAFPMTSTGRTSVMDAPSLVSDEQLHELKLSVTSREKSPYDQIIDQLTHADCDFELYSHKPVYTSQEAADIRGEPIEIGAKSLVLQADKQFILYVVPGNNRADLEMLQQFLGVKKIAMASKDSITAKTGLEVGCIPPFGSIMKILTYVDPDMILLEKIAFNPGRHDKSIVMKTEDYLRLEKPVTVK